jgi:hypothetical protein
MKALEITKYTLVLTGAVLITISTIGFVKTRSFIDNAISTEGFVVGFDSPTGNLPNSNASSTGRSRPLIEFQLKDGRPLTFKSPSDNGVEWYQIGEGIPILYDKNNPKHAEIDDFSRLWAGILVVGGLGISCFAIGLSLLLVGTSKGRKRSRLMRRGIRIKTQFYRLEQNAFIEVNGHSPYQILTTWKDPTDSQQHIFKSDNIWEDPTVFIPEKIVVFIGKDNPRDYYVDLSFIPVT